MKLNCSEAGFETETTAKLLLAKQHQRCSKEVHQGGFSEATLKVFKKIIYKIWFLKIHIRKNIKKEMVF